MNPKYTITLVFVLCNPELNKKIPVLCQYLQIARAANQVF